MREGLRYARKKDLYAVKLETGGGLSVRCDLRSALCALLSCRPPRVTDRGRASDSAVFHGHSFTTLRTQNQNCTGLAQIVGQLYM